MNYLKLSLVCLISLSATSFAQIPDDQYSGETDDMMVSPSSGMDYDRAPGTDVIEVPREEQEFDYEMDQMEMQEEDIYTGDEEYYE